MQELPLTTSETVTIPKDSASEQTPTPKMSLKRAMKLISSSYKRGVIGKVELAELRKQLGIPVSSFTKKKVKIEVKKARKKIASASRKRNRGQGKGQKRNNGHAQSKSN